MKATARKWLFYESKKMTGNNPEKDRQAKKAKRRKREGAAERFKPGGSNRSKRSRGRGG